MAFKGNAGLRCHLKICPYLWTSREDSFPRTCQMSCYFEIRRRIIEKVHEDRFRSRFYCPYRKSWQQLAEQRDKRSEIPHWRLCNNIQITWLCHKNVSKRRTWPLLKKPSKLSKKIRPSAIGLLSSSETLPIPGYKPCQEWPYPASIPEIDCLWFHEQFHHLWDGHWQQSLICKGYRWHPGQEGRYCNL